MKIVLMLLVVVTTAATVTTGYFLNQSYAEFTKVYDERNLASLQQELHASEEKMASAHGEEAAKASSGAGHGEASSSGVTIDASGGTTDKHSLFLKEVFVNLNAESGTHYMKLVVNVELFDKSDFRYVDKLKTGLSHNLIVLGRSKTFEEMNSIVGLLYFKEQLVARFNSYLNKAAVKDVNFEDFYIQ